VATRAGSAAAVGALDENALMLASACDVVHGAMTASRGEVVESTSLLRRVVWRLRSEIPSQSNEQTQTTATHTLTSNVVAVVVVIALRLLAWRVSVHRRNNAFTHTRSAISLARRSPCSSSLSCALAQLHERLACLLSESYISRVVCLS
jgi:cytochrome b561